MPALTYPVLPQKIAQYMAQQIMVGNYLPIVLCAAVIVGIIVAVIIIGKLYDNDEKTK